MSLDPYSYCPCGSGKKIKFCCRELAGEIEKIERMLEADQRQACLEYVESLSKRHPLHPYLQTKRSALLMEANRLDEADELLSELVRAHPRNVVVLAHAVILVARREDQQVQTAIELLQRAVELRAESLPGVFFEAALSVAQRAVNEGCMQAGLAHLLLVSNWTGRHAAIRSTVRSFQRNRDIPLQFRDTVYWRSFPADHPGAADEAAARARFEQGCFRQAERMLTELTQRYPDQPVLWRNLALVRGTLADLDGEREALRAYVQLPQLSWDDAVEAESLALLLDRDHSEPHVSCLTWELPIRDMEQALQRLIDDRRAVSIPIEGWNAAERGEPRPRAAFDILDRAPISEDERRNGATPPMVVGQSLLFGRQTDREARIVSCAWGDRNMAATQSALRSILGEAAGEPGEPTQLVTVPFYTALWNDIPFLAPPAHDDDVVRLRRDHYRRVVQQVWPDLPLRQLDGKSPRQAVQDAGLRRRVAALLLQFQLDGPPLLTAADIDAARQQLGLPLPEPITRDAVEPVVARAESADWVRDSSKRAAASGKLSFFELSAAQLHRLRLSDFSTFELLVLIELLIPWFCTEQLAAVSSELLDRPDVEQHANPWQLAQVAASPLSASDALQRVGQWRQRFQGAGPCDYHWDLVELDILLRSNDGTRLKDLLYHLLHQHGAEPEVQEHVGSLIASIRRAQDGPDVSAGAGELVGQAEPPPRRLWTPDSEPARTPSGLWLPD